MDPELITIILDAKKPLIVGTRHTEGSNDPYNYHNVTVFGAVAMVRGEKQRVPEYTYHDGVSTWKINNAEAHEQVTHFLINTPELWNIAATKTKIEFRFDNNGPFISQQFAYYILREIKQVFWWMQEVTWRPFVAQHGKSDCDRHFAVITRWKKEWLKKPGNKLDTVADVVEMIRWNADNGGCKTKDRVFAYPFQLHHPGPGDVLRRLIFPGIQSCISCTYLRNCDDVILRLFPDDENKVGDGLRGFTVEDNFFNEAGKYTPLAGEYKNKQIKQSTGHRKCLANYIKQRHWTCMQIAQDRYGVPMSMSDSGDSLIAELITKDVQAEFDCTVFG